MKKVIISLFIPFLLLISCQSASDESVSPAPSSSLSSSPPPASSAAASTVSPSRLKVSVDPRLELLAVVQYLSGYREKFGLLNKFQFSYWEKIKEKFTPYKNHQAVQFFARLTDYGFTYDAPPLFVLHLSSPPELKIEHPFSTEVKVRAGGEKNLKKFTSLLRDFARRTNFMAFFQAQQDYFARLTEPVRSTLAKLRLVETLEEYFGQQQSSYNIILAPLFWGNYGPHLKADQGYDIYNIVSPIRLKQGLPYFGDGVYFQSLAWHEFSHSFVNPLAEKYQDELKKYAVLYPPIEKKMKAQAYTSWLIAVNEHVVRAVTSRLAARLYSPQLGEQALKAEERKGFIYIQPLYEKLEFYETHRDQYPSFADFYPELLKVWAELAEHPPEKILFAGPINAVVMDRANVVLVVPTHEKDPAAQQKIHQYVKQIQRQFFPGRPIMTDEEALQKDLSPYAVVIYGTPEGNRLLARLLPQLPVRFGKQRIMAGQVFEGDHLRFITAWPNPDNPEQGILIYTAQQAGDIPGINTLFHGPTDYVIAQGKKILKAADYRKEKGVWKF